jgi:hypothetical protein
MEVEFCLDVVEEALARYGRVMSTTTAKSCVICEVRAVTSAIACA